jgi:hydrogenase maturation factor
MGKKDKTRLKAGKLPAFMLERLLGRYATTTGSGVVVGPGIGLDAAVIDFRRGYLVAKTDPITLVEGDAGLYAINVNANDIAVMGGVPRWFLATILFPEKNTTEQGVEKIFRDIKRACADLGISLVGGHTEVTPVVNVPVIIGQMLGEVPRRRLLTAAGARRGDALILTEGIAIEGTSIIARTLGGDLVRSGAFSKTFITRCRRLVSKPGISVLPAVRTAMEAGTVHAMHDPTEGGLAAALHEVSSASGLAIEITEEDVPVLTPTRKLCARLGLDPMGLIASGALLLAAPRRSAPRIMKALENKGIPASLIGVVTGRGQGVTIRRGGKAAPLPLPERDEITKII